MHQLLPLRWYGCNDIGNDEVCLHYIHTSVIVANHDPVCTMAEACYVDTELELVVSVYIESSCLLSVNEFSPST